MFLIVKLAESTLLPSNLIVEIALLGLIALILRWRRTGVAFLASSSVLLALAGWSPFGPFALMTLENRFPQTRLTQPPAGIIMLGGAVNVHITADRGQPALNEAAERITATAVLARQYPGARILLSGGANDGVHSTATESSVAKDVVVGMGIKPERIETEEQSRTTYENAVRSLAIAKPQGTDRWLLVTSASHMPRAVASFRAVGFPVVPFPVDYRTRGQRDLFRPTESIAVGLSDLDLAVHEWLGLVGYRLLGRTRELFPSP